MQSLKWKRPKRLRILIFILVLSPFLNLVHFSIQYHLSIFQWKELFLNLPNMALPLLIAPFILAYGIHNAYRWAYFTFLAFAAILISYNIYVSYSRKDLRNYSATLQSIVLLVGAGILLNTEIAAPYRNPGVRGWRLKKRKELELPIILNDVETATKDISLTGAFIHTNSEKFKLGTPVKLKLSKGKNNLSLDGEVLRLADSGISVAFAFPSKEYKDTLKLILKQKEEE